MCVCVCVCLSNAHATVCIRGCCWCQPSSMPRPWTWTPPWPQPSAMVFAARRWHSCWLLERCTHAFLNIYTHVYIYIHEHSCICIYVFIYTWFASRFKGWPCSCVGFPRQSVLGWRACVYTHTYIYTYCLRLRSRLRSSQHRQSPPPQYLLALGSRRCCAPVGPYIKTNKTCIHIYINICTKESRYMHIYMCTWI